MPTGNRKSKTGIRTEIFANDSKVPMLSAAKAKYLKKNRIPRLNTTHPARHHFFSLFDFMPFPCADADNASPLTHVVKVEASIKTAYPGFQLM